MEVLQKYGCIESLTSGLSGKSGQPIIKLSRLKNLHIMEGIMAMFEFEYQLLGRLKSDCDYYLGFGYAFEGHLWAGTVEG